MKKNGFMLFETLIVSTIILGTLIFLFVQFSAIKRNYSTSFNYNTIPGLYNAKTLATYLEEDGYVIYDYELSEETINGYIKINDCHGSMQTICKKIVQNIDAKHILFVGNNISTLKNNLSTSNYDVSVFNEKFRQFILTINTIEITGKNRLIIEYNNGTFATINIGISKDESDKVEYVVNHYQMNLDGSTYSLKESETFSWLSGYIVEPNVKNYIGFTSPDKQVVTVETNTVVNYYYDRNKYLLTLYNGTNTASTDGAGEYYFEQDVIVTAVPNEGYEFDNWSGDMTESRFKMPAKNISMTANCK